eukprot:11226022-Karenia_brevis.AAC.1
MSEASLPASSIIGDERVEDDFSYETVDESQYPVNMVAEPNNSRRSDEDIARIVSLVVQGLLPQNNRQSHGGRVETVDGIKK